MNCRLLFVLFAMFLSCRLPLLAQSGKWTWVRGSASSWSGGNYGIKGVPDPANEPPARYQPAYWTDLQGNFWLFGGNNGSGLVNDLWKYNPLTNLWTWMNGPQGNTNPAGVFGVQGVPSPLNYPQALGYGAINWVDENGDLWLYGGLNFTSQMDGLWRYHIPTNEWTWMKGTIGNTTMVPGIQGQFNPLNTPGGINECKSAWVLNNQLWFFGGQNAAGEQLGSLWCYDIATNNWCWKSGLTVPYYIGNYGTKGVSSPLNFPPARVSYTNWKDTADQFYLFAGDLTFGSSNIGNNDVWRYSPALNEWTWIGGSSSINHPGYGQNYCDHDTMNIPRSRVENMSVQSGNKCANAFWTFGGFSTSGHDFHNDLWLFNPDSNAWKLVKGHTSTGGFGTYVAYHYGLQGVPDTANLPPGRGGGAIWNDNDGNVWVFGGSARDASGSGFNNDLWKFEPDTACFHLMVERYYFHLEQDSVTLCKGDTFVMPVPRNLEFQVLPNTNVSYDSLQNTLSFYAFSPNTYTIIASSPIQNTPCSYIDSFVFHLNTVPAPVAGFVLNPTATNMSSPTFTLTSTATNATSLTWYDSAWNVLGTSATLIKTYIKAGTYCITLVAGNNCNQFDTITKCGTISDEFNTGIPTIEPAKKGIFIPGAFTPNNDGINDTFKPIVTKNGRVVSLDIFNRWGEQVFHDTGNPIEWNGLYRDMPAEQGTYLYRIVYQDEQEKRFHLSGDFNLIR